jgi:hypothetical protein
MFSIAVAVTVFVAVAELSVSGILLVTFSFVIFSCIIFSTTGILTGVLIL